MFEIIFTKISLISGHYQDGQHTSVLIFFVVFLKK